MYTSQYKLDHTTVCSALGLTRPSLIKGFLLLLSISKDAISEVSLCSRFDNVESENLVFVSIGLVNAGVRYELPLFLLSIGVGSECTGKGRLPSIEIPENKTNTIKYKSITIEKNAYRPT